MNRKMIKIAFGFLFLFSPLIGSSIANNSSLQSAHPLVFISEIRGTINPASSDYLKDSIKQSVQQNADVLLVELDTPGGLVTSVREMTQAIDESKVPVVVYVNPAGAAATSAGALLTIGAHIGAMAPGTNIGAAHPVGAEGKEVKGAAGEKAKNDVAAMARSLATLRGKNIELAQKVVTKSESFTAKEALEKNLIDFVVSTRSELLSKLDGRKVKTKYGESLIKTKGAQMNRVEMSLGQKLLHILAHPNVAAILMTIGMILIYVEISNPGITVAGVAGALCLLIAFTALQVLPIQTAGVVLIILGVILMALEPFIPSGGIFAGGGVIAFMLGLIWSIDPNETDLRVSQAVMLSSGLGLGLTALVIGWSASRMKRLSKELHEKLGGGSDLAGLKGYEGIVINVRSNGKTGKAKFRGEVWDFVSNASVKPEDTVQITGVDGFKVKVKTKV